MVVHLGVVVIAVALAAATSFGHRGEVTLRPGQVASSDGHTIKFVGLTHLRTAARTATEAIVVVDGHGPLRPAVSQFGANTEAVGTPAIDSNLADDVYLTLDGYPADAAKTGGPVTIGVTVQPLVAWLWGGGALLVLGAALAAVPGKRRRPTDPVSAPVPAVGAGDGSTGSGDSAAPPRVVLPDGPRPARPERSDDDERAPEPVPAGSP
jgi:cytochrome c-type biogenesis protein CcmF